MEAVTAEIVSLARAKVTSQSEMAAKGEMIVGEFWLLDGDGRRVEESDRPAAFTLHPECLGPWRVARGG